MAPAEYSKVKHLAGRLDKPLIPRYLKRMKRDSVFKPSYSHAPRIHKAEARARVTNGKELLPNVDGRSLWVRRFKDVLALHVSDMGGEAACSEAEKALARRAACLIVELEQLEQRFAQAGSAEGNLIERYQRLANTLRRLLVSMGLERRARDMTPTLEEYCKMKALENHDDLRRD